MKRVLAAAWLVFVLGSSACRFGGPSGDPTTPIVIPVDASSKDVVVVDDSGTPVDDSAIDDSAATLDSGVLDGDAIAEVSDGPDASDVLEAETIGDAPDDGEEAGVCAPPTTPFAVCDPVRNTGCSFIVRCDVNTDTKGEGRCVGLGALGENAFCTSASWTDTCSATLTCISNKCRKLCFCNADCGSECCTEDVGSTGFKVCAACTP